MKIQHPTRLALAAGFVLVVTLACSVTIQVPPSLQTALPQFPQLTPQALPEATIQAVTTPTDCPNGDCARVCLSRLSSIPQTGGSSESTSKGPGPTGKPEGAVVLATYPVSGNNLGPVQFPDQAPAGLTGLQHDAFTQAQIWDYFKAIIPADQRTSISYYIVSTDGKGRMLASVEQFAGQTGMWALVVDPADAGKPRDLTSTLLHEFGHLLTLDSSQVRPDEAVLSHPGDMQVYEKEAATCPNYFASGGCSLTDSYINHYYDLFWAKIYREWSTVNAARRKSNYLALLARFYHNHPTQFVTPYAATSPEEDMAETWAYFVLNPRPADDSVAQKKVLFFYQYPELVDLRNQIVSNICTYAASH